MKNNLLNQLKAEGIIDEETFRKIEDAESGKFFSIHWQLKTLLYLGVSLFAAGLGVFIYENIDTIGHLTIVVIIGLISAGCFWFCLRNIQPFSRGKIGPQGIWHDYILLLGCLTFLIFEGYLQWQFNIFGDRYGLATIIPTIILLTIAYWFDHLGVLTMAITLFSSWVGISLAPIDFFSRNDFWGEEFIYSGGIPGVVFGGLAYLHTKFDFKKHYTFTYANFASHLSCVAFLSAVIIFDRWFLWVPLLAISIYCVITYAKAIRSFYLILCGVLYAYVGISYLFIAKIVIAIDDIGAVYIGLLYFIGSAIFAIFLLKKFKNSIGPV